ncbi:MAG: GtrA family protein [Bryobacteraceae bacterium]|nr:GtrA family protein [Bryobacteraceae bacterium]MDW8377531.1 GtrA family protein [Bryobacterales bacterium]
MTPGAPNPAPGVWAVAAPQRQRANLIQQFVRYLLVGGAAFVIDFSLLYFLTESARLHYLTAAAASFLAGLIFTYTLSRMWVFDVRTLNHTPMEFLVFSAVGLIGLALNEAILWVAVGSLHMHYLHAKLGSAAMVLIWNFSARRTLLFR